MYQKNQSVHDVLSWRPIKKTREEDEYLRNIIKKEQEKTEPSPVNYSSRDQRDASVRNAYSERLKGEEKERSEFLKGFNHYESESENPLKSETSLATRLFNAPKENQNTKKDEFLKGLNEAQEEETAWNRMLDSLKKGVSKTFEEAKERDFNPLNFASAWANEKGVFDDVTNAFFKTYDSAQDFLVKNHITEGLHKDIAEKNYDHNKRQHLRSYERTDGYINDQSDKYGQIKNIKYGMRNMDYNGCGIIAVNNALVSLGDRQDIRDIARDFETDGQTLFGFFGTSPYAIGDYFRKKGYEVSTFEGDDKIYNLELPDADTYIMSFWNSDNISDGVHIVSMDKLPNGKYRIYNDSDDYGTPTKEINSLNEYFKKEGGAPLVLHCIKKGRK